MKNRATIATYPHGNTNGSPANIWPRCYITPINQFLWVAVLLWGLLPCMKAATVGIGEFNEGSDYEPLIVLTVGNSGKSYIQGPGNCGVGGYGTGYPIEVGQ